MADVPAIVVTVTSTVPLPAGLVAVICVSLSTVTLLAATCPKETLVAPVKLVPVMATAVPPAAGPLAGLILNTVGGTGIGIGVGDAWTVGFGVGRGLWVGESWTVGFGVECGLWVGDG